jgi:alanine-synthesizing transaminase
LDPKEKLLYFYKLPAPAWNLATSRADDDEMFADRTNWNLTPNRLSETLAQHLAAGKRIYDLSASNPTEGGFEYAGEAILQALCNDAALTYVPDPKGLLRGRQGVAEYYAARGDIVPVEDIILITSTSEAYSFVFRTLCNPGDELLVPAPSYPLFGFLADIHDVRLAQYPLIYDYGWHMDFHALEQAIKPEDLAKLNEICTLGGMAVIADEVFLDFAAGECTLRRDVVKNVRHRAANGRKPASLAVNTGALTFTMSGLSKISGLPQMKAAWLVASGPEACKTKALERLEVIADTYLSMNTPVQLALPELLHQRHGFQRQVVTRVRRNLAELDRQLTHRKSCSRLEVEGGWYAVLRVPATRSDDDLAVELLKTKGIYVHPGHFYDFPSDGFLIVSLIMQEREFAEGIRLLLSAF